MQEDDEEILKKTTKEIHDNAIEIEKSIKQQDLLIEIISNTTTRNSQIIRKGKNKMGKAFEALKKDSRNYVILILLLLIIIVGFFIF